jgi:transposase
VIARARPGRAADCQMAAAAGLYARGASARQAAAALRVSVASARLLGAQLQRGLDAGKAGTP